MRQKHTAVVYALIRPNAVIGAMDIRRDAFWNGRAMTAGEVSAALQCLCRSGRIVRASRGFYARAKTPAHIIDWHKADIATSAAGRAKPGIFKREREARAAYLDTPSEKTLGAYRWAKGMAAKARREKHSIGA
jgi:hypothetical protein